MRTGTACKAWFCQAATGDADGSYGHRPGELRGLPSDMGDTVSIPDADPIGWQLQMAALGVDEGRCQTAAADARDRFGDAPTVDGG